jgi:photosystem II stability/assembly factor-like uncharacterized protein
VALALKTGFASVSGRVISLVINPITPTILYAGAHFGGVFRSTDSGAHWVAANTGLPRDGYSALYVSFLAIDPRTPSTLYARTYVDHVFRSTDSGGHWTAISAGLFNKDVPCLAINPHTPSTLYAGTNGGVFRSTDGGNHWMAVNTGLTHHYVYSVALDPKTPTTLYASTNEDIFRSTDSGGHWTGLKTGYAGVSGYVTSLAINPKIPTTLYAGTDRGVFRSVNSGATWTAINTGVTNNGVSCFAIDPLAPANLYVGTNGGVFRSTDGGNHWMSMNSGLTRQSVISLAVDRLTPGILYAVADGGGIFRYGAASSSKGIIQLKIGSKTMYVDGKPVPLEAAPIILNSRTFLPIRALIETLSGEVLWSASARSVDVFLGDHSVDVAVGGNIGYINDKAVAIDPANPKVVPVIINSRTFLPLRFVAEALALGVQWDGTTQTITITYTL